MIQKKTKSSFWGGPPEVCYHDPESKLDYRWILGGMAWPDTLPGFVVIVGEEFEQEETLGEYRCRILTEYESQNPSDLIRRSKEYESLFQAKNIYGDTSHRPMMDFINSGKVNLYLSDAPFSDESIADRYYLSLIREATSATKKVLLFGKGSKLPGSLAGINDDLVLPPVVLALGYVLAAIKAYSPDPNEHLLMQHDPIPAY